MFFKLQNIFDGSLMHALFYTLLHSLWQGVLIAAVTAIVLYQTKRSAPASRYKLLCGLLFLFLCVCGATFLYEAVSSAKNINPVYFNATAHRIDAVKNIVPGKSFKEEMVAKFQSLQYIAVIIYFLIVLFKCIKIVGGFSTIYKLKNRNVFPADEYWDDVIKKLSAKIKLKKPVQLLQSAIAKTPFTIGHFKPVILFPVAVFTNLPATEIEMILLHELAHIKRKDYLINILQTFVETLFFFNPAVLWLSSLIKDERENCCDDIAINQTNNKKQFIQALVSFQENQTAYGAATFFAGKKGQLFNRVKRIITNNNKTLNNMEKIILISGIIVTGLTAAMVPQNFQPHFIQKTIANEKSKVVPFIINDTVPLVKSNEHESKIVEHTQINGKQYRLEKTDDKISLYENGSKIPDEKLDDYSAVINEIEAKFSANQDAEIAAKNLKEKMLEINKQSAAISKQAETLTDQKALQELSQKLAETKLSAKDNKQLLASIDAQKAAVFAKLEALKNNKDLAQLQQTESLKALIDAEVNVNEQRALIEAQVLNQKALQDQTEDLMRQKTDLLKQNKEFINQQMQQQINDLKEQQKNLMRENQMLRDSLNRTNPGKSNGFIGGALPDVAVH